MVLADDDLSVVTGVAGRVAERAAGRGFLPAGNAEPEAESGRGDLDAADEGVDAQWIFCVVSADGGCSNVSRMLWAPSPPLVVVGGDHSTPWAAAAGRDAKCRRSAAVGPSLTVGGEMSEMSRWSVSQEVPSEHMSARTRKPRVMKMRLDSVHEVVMGCRGPVSDPRRCHVERHAL